ncbi:MAG TPA: sulfatase-like hydrolase/transferase, partial [Polyangiaceae bacterium]|nr:sulfatase-like hydrolase/transferase [Polyangiaceae bacterium]
TWWGSAARVRVAAAGAILVASAVSLVRAPARLGLYDNLRFIYLERAPLLSHAVRLAAMLAPPPPLDGDAADAQGRGGSLDMRGRDVLLVTIDALRADHVGAYGYERRVTPNLDALAREGALFEAAYTATPHTSYAVASLMTGKYMRPLLLQGVGDGSESWAEVLRRYGYRTAGFFPPAVFFIDRERFTSFERTGLGFEYHKVQFSTAAARASEVEKYLGAQSDEQRLFVWVHLFEPHEPYEAHAQHDFGTRSIDRYDSEIAAADAGLGALVKAWRARRPKGIVIVGADHGEEFEDHGGRYHGTTVYEEQVRVPLVFNAPGLVAPRRVAEPVSLVDLMPTVLGGLGIPVSPRVRGRDLGPLLTGAANGQGFAFAETDEQTLLARGKLRLICARRVGACRLFDVAADPGERVDAAAKHAETFGKLKRELASFVASLGRFEQGEKSWPQALRRGIAGDVEAAMEVAALLDDADVAIRQKAAKVLFELARDETAGHLRRALRADEDKVVRAWSALALTRVGQGAPLVYDLLTGDDLGWKRLAALALAESGDARGEDVLLAWWSRAFPAKDKEKPEPIPFERARAVALALGRIKSEDAVGPLTRGLADVRLRVHVAKALAAIGEDAARPALAEALAEERYQDARVAIARALVALGGDVELRGPLVRFLGVPDALPGGLAIALEADVLELIGGPKERELERLRAFATSGVAVGMVIPDIDVPARGLRTVVRARATGGDAGEVRIGLLTKPRHPGDRKRPVPKTAPELVPELTATIRVTPSE